jgi:hypothetical protein
MSISTLVTPSQVDVTPAEAPNDTYTFAAMPNPTESPVKGVPDRSDPNTRRVASAWVTQNPLQPTFPACSYAKNASQSTASKAQRALTAAQKHSKQESRDKEIEKIHTDLDAAIESAALQLGTQSCLFRCNFSTKFLCRI